MSACAVYTYTLYFISIHFALSRVYNVPGRKTREDNQSSRAARAPQTNNIISSPFLPRPSLQNTRTRLYKRRENAVSARVHRNYVIIGNDSLTDVSPAVTYTKARRVHTLMYIRIYVCHNAISRVKRKYLAARAGTDIISLSPACAHARTMLIYTCLGSACTHAHI